MFHETAEMGPSARWVGTFFPSYLKNELSGKAMLSLVTVARQVVSGKTRAKVN